MKRSYIARRFQSSGAGLSLDTEALAKYKDIIDLSIGDTDFTTDESIINAAFRDARAGHTHYGDPKGDPELIDAVCRAWEEDFGQRLPRDHVLVSASSCLGMALVMLAILDPGDEVIVFSPYFPMYREQIELAGGVCVDVPTYASEDYAIDEARLRAAITPRTKLLILPYPNNPTGAIMDRDELQAIANVIRETNIMVLSDEIYNSLTYGPDRHVCFAEIDGMKERTIVVDGFSKSYAMTGWRLGWAMGPKELMRHICKIHQFGIMSAPTTAQFAGIEAIRTGDDDIARMRDQYDLRRRYLLGELRSMGLECFEPEGAFYIFPSIESTGLSSEEFCERLLHEQEVAVIPGSAFGASGEGHVRISYSYSMSHLREACSRMKIFLENLKQEQK